MLSLKERNKPLGIFSFFTAAHPNGYKCPQIHPGNSVQIEGKGFQEISLAVSHEFNLRKLNAGPLFSTFGTSHYVRS